MLMRGLEWFFRDRVTGRIVVGQWPNLALWLFGATRLVAIVSDGSLWYWAWITSELCLLVWAADELVRGVNPWRRCLGAGVLIWMGVSRLT